MNPVGIVNKFFPVRGKRGVNRWIVLVDLSNVTLFLIILNLLYRPEVAFFPE